MNWFSRLLSLLAVSLGFGCDSGDTDKPKMLVGSYSGEGELPDGVMLHEGRSPDAPARVDRNPVLLQDAEEIRKTRETYQRELDQRYATAISQVKKGDWVFLEYIRALEAQSQKATADLQQIMNSSSLPAKSRTKAAEMFARLKDPCGEAFLLDSLNSSDAELRLAALNSLGQYELRTDFNSEGMSELVIGLLDDPDSRVVEVASRLCWTRKIPGAEGAMLAALESGKAESPAKLAENLAELATNRETVEAILPHVLQDSPEKYNWNAGYPFRNLLKNPEAAISGPIRKALYAYTLKFPQQRYDQSLVRDLAAAAGPDATDVLSDIQKNAKDPVSRMYATEALARLQPEQGVNLYLAFVDDNKWYGNISDDIAKYAKPGDFERISQRLLAMDKPWDGSVVLLCYDTFDEAGKKFIEQNQDRLDPVAQSVAYWKSQGIDLKVALADFHAAGIVSQMPDELLAEMAKPGPSGDGPKEIDFNNPYELIGALAFAEIVVMFDAESGQIPCDHAQLLFDFARASRGKFAPEAPVQFWLRKAEDDYDGPYIVQFISDGRLFRCGAENYGDWYDVQAVMNLANFTLTETGHAERFISLESSGQFVSLVFADPAKFFPLAEKYRIPLAEDASQAMQKGIEFEQRVRESSQ
ncbi:hypothetical protein C5Y96_03900 [Blastopirellula marina]|uniref:HEAT repeat domain-containing protein n=1 Tax=Blastopirellula marina TaxID=124 RepID=A0A2S8G3I6_9BACT|nr:MULTISPECIES: HEAT repeat domain-containing protein [Pirellulaceae]PQO39019.1 hypothetical protein C5Y96_03900 [Blastopirellula marina]RCS55327.1 HEAT repeat domain-containing protein [Bremerella cremea]